MNIEINMNLNEFVEVELTEAGKKAITQRGFEPDYKRFNSNFIKIQLWELMNNLGDSIFNGSDQVIVDNRITILAKHIAI